MAYSAFSCNLQHRWAVPTGKTEEVQDPAVQQVVEKLRTIAAPFLKLEGKRAQLEFFVRTSEGRFQIKSFPGEAVEDLLARIAYVALMPDHGGLETASVRVVTDVSAFERTSSTCGSSVCLSRRSSVSTTASGSDVGSISSLESDFCSDTDAGSERRLRVRFSAVEEEIFYIAEPAEEDTLPEDQPVEKDLLGSALSHLSLFF